MINEELLIQVAKTSLVIGIEIVLGREVAQVIGPIIDEDYQSG
jgi:hypothetical protein